MPKGTTSFKNQIITIGNLAICRTERHSCLSRICCLMNTITQEFFSCQTSSIAKNDTFRQFRNSSAVRRFRQKKSWKFSCMHLCKSNLRPWRTLLWKRKSPLPWWMGTGCIFLSELGFQKRIKDLSVFLFLWLKYITDARKMCVYCLNRFLGNY